MHQTLYFTQLACRLLYHGDTGLLYFSITQAVKPQAHKPTSHQAVSSVQAAMPTLAPIPRTIAIVGPEIRRLEPGVSRVDAALDLKLVGPCRVIRCEPAAGPASVGLSSFCKSFSFSEVQAHQAPKLKAPEHLARRRRTGPGQWRARHSPHLMRPLTWASMG